MKYYLTIAVFVLAALNMFAAEPIAQLEAIPDYAQFSQYDDNELWFQNKLMEYYKAAIIFDTQIKIQGDIPLVIYATPSIDDFESSDYKVLSKYYNIAKKLYDQVVSLPSGMEERKIKELQGKIHALELENFTIKDENFNLEMDNNKVSFYKSHYENLLRNIDSLKSSVDSAIYESYDKSIKAYSLLNNFDRNKYSIFSVSASAFEYDYNNSHVDASIAPSFAMNFNPGKLFGIGRILEFWGDYSYITSDVKSGSSTTETKYRNNTNLFSIGLSFILPIDQMLKIKDFNANLDIGFGYFHAETKCPNTTKDNHSSDGNLIKLELNLANFNKYFPFSVFADLNFNKYNQDLNLSGKETLKLGQPWITSFAVGLRFPLWQNINY